MIRQMCARILSLLTVILLLSTLIFSVNSYGDFLQKNDKKTALNLDQKKDKTAILIIENEEVETSSNENVDDLIDLDTYPAHQNFTFEPAILSQSNAFTVHDQNNPVLKSEKWMVNIQILI